jgi:hypothetical protein
VPESRAHPTSVTTDCSFDIRSVDKISVLHLFAVFDFKLSNIASVLAHVSVAAAAELLHLLPVSQQNTHRFSFITTSQRFWQTIHSLPLPNFLPFELRANTYTLRF